MNITQGARKNIGHVLMVRPAAFVGPAMFNVSMFLPSPAFWMLSTWISVAFGART